MGDLTVEVLDFKGRPQKNAKVRVELKKHQFGFGVAVGLRAMFEQRDTQQRQNYEQVVTNLFNTVTIENRLKWKFYRENDPVLEEAIRWCEEQNISVRGHCMVWPDWNRIPKSLRSYAENPEGFPEVIVEHVRKMAALYPEVITEWDVANELYKEHTFMDLFGTDIVADWFRAAKETRPTFASYINDYAILAGNDEAHRQGYFDWIDSLLKQNAPLDGIGFQSHFRAPVPPEEIWRRLNRFAEFGLEMQVTEYDFDETDEALQERFTRDFMTVVFSHPQMVGIITWCLWEPTSWKPNAAFFSKDWEKKPIAKAWESLVKEEWHTDETRRTDRDGHVAFRGFLGEYEVSAKYLSWEKTVPVVLTKEGRVLRIQLGRK